MKKHKESATAALLVPKWDNTLSHFIHINNSQRRIPQSQPHQYKVIKGRTTGLTVIGRLIVNAMHLLPALNRGGINTLRCPGARS